MVSGSLSRVSRILGVCALVAFAGFAVSSVADDRPAKNRQVIVPGEDRFTPFGLTIRASQSVQWINMDTDDHTVVSDDFFNTAGNNGTDVLIPGTDSNRGNRHVHASLLQARHIHLLLQVPLASG